MRQNRSRRTFQREPVYNYRIEKFRYAELRAFCRQYADKKAEADLLLTPRAQELTGMPSGSGVGDPVASAVERRENLLKDCELIEECAMDVQEGLYYHAIIHNACMGKPYDCIIDMLPVTNRNAFFAARREFFRLLDKKKR